MLVTSGPVPGTHFAQLNFSELFNIPIRADIQLKNEEIVIDLFNGSANCPTIQLTMNRLEPRRIKWAVNHLYNIFHDEPIEPAISEDICQYICHYTGINYLGWPDHSPI